MMITCGFVSFTHTVICVDKNLDESPFNKFRGIYHLCFDMPPQLHEPKCKMHLASAVKK